MKSHIIASAFFLATLGGAHAADVVVQEGAAAYNWSGVYVGIQAGYAWGRSDYVEPFNTDYQMEYDPKGGFGGVFVGYNWQLANNFVLGAEADVYGGNIKGTSLYYYNDAQADDGFGTAKLNWAGSVRARVGYSADRFLPYVAGGLAFGQYKYGGEVPDWDSRFSASRTYTGWTLGAGLEYAVTDNLIARFEYRYTDFGNKTITDPDGWWTNKVDLKTNDVRFGISYKF
ncbi:outer membrane protein [Mesorhizobium sp. ANAO-SY3R2]|uniref:outer membrane protein n=1 Tax=Mesorhizobium sp. ANAO-SY3R2 TaxID=3166644 RepID=UPI00366DE03D